MKGALSMTDPYVIKPFVPRHGPSRPREQPARVVNLYVERRARQLERDGDVQTWRCLCGWRFFEKVRFRGWCCERCGKEVRPYD